MRGSRRWSEEVRIKVGRVSGGCTHLGVGLLLPTRPPKGTVRGRSAEVTSLPQIGRYQETSEVYK